MYDENTRNIALALLDQGYSPHEASMMMGGRPGHAIIRRWKAGKLPVGKRSRACALSADQKVEALERVEAGEDYKEVAAEIGCAPSTILTWRRRFCEGGRDALITRIDRYLES